MNFQTPDIAELLISSYERLLGERLVPMGVPDASIWLYEAPFGLLAHDTSPDPVFCYANRTAQQRFGYTWNEFIGLPSRLSADREDRETRRMLLEGVIRQGYTRYYRGPRVAKSGQRFWIDGVTVWNVLGANSTLVGQAALIRDWTDA